MSKHSNESTKLRKGTNLKTKWSLGMMAVVLAVAPIVPAASAATTATVSSASTAISKVVKPIYISKTSYVNMVDAGLSPTDNGQTVAFTISIYNGDSKTLNLNDYWFRLSTLSGASYSLKMQDSTITKVAAKTKTIITLYATVGEQVTLSDLILKVVKFDFSTAGYEKTVGKFSIPSKYTNVVAPGSYKVLYFTNTTLNTKVSSATVGASGDDNLATINFVYNNVGKKSVTLSNYKYYIVTSGGLIYEAKPTDATDLVLAPLQREEIELTATVPATVKTNGWKLIVQRNTGGDSGVTLPIGTYQINFSGGTTSIGTDTFNYANTSGAYQYQLTQLVREPYQTQDILAARIRITNKSSTSVTVPNVSGYFYLDNNVKLDFKTIAVDNQTGLNSGGYVDLDVYAKMPANYIFTTAKLIVNNTVDQKTTKVGELTGTSYLSSIPTYAVDKAYQINRDGSQMTGTLNNVNVYKNTTSQEYNVQLTLTNNERRAINPSALVGVFVNDNGDYFPATTTAVDGNVNPSNKALVTFSTTLPLNYSTANLKLIVGEGLADGKYATGKTATDAYINAVIYSLPQDQSTNTTMSNISLLPYNLTINKFTPQVYGTDLQLTLDYDLVKDTMYNLYPTNRSLLLTIEGKDTNDGTVYTYSSQAITLEGDSGDTLVAGEGNEITLSTAKLKIDTIDGRLNYTAKLYEVVDGSKKLIAERPFYWFIENDWTTATK
jgi:hypothetical protein